MLNAANFNQPVDHCFLRLTVHWPNSLERLTFRSMHASVKGEALGSHIPASKQQTPHCDDTITEITSPARTSSSADRISSIAVRMVRNLRFIVTMTTTPISNREMFC